MTEEILMTRKSRMKWAAASWTTALVVFLTATYVAYRREHRRADEMSDRQVAMLALIESADYGFAILDQDGKVREWSPALERLSGYTRGEMLGQDVKGLMPADMAERHAAAFTKAITDPSASRRVQVVECQIQPKDKDKKPVDVRVSVRVVQASRDGSVSPYAIAHIDRRSRIVELSADAVEAKHAPVEAEGGL